MSGTQIDTLVKSVDGGWWAALAFIGLWGWRALSGMRNLGRMEQQVCDMRKTFDRHIAAELVWQRDVTARLDRLVERKGAS